MGEKRIAQFGAWSQPGGTFARAQTHVHAICERVFYPTGGCGVLRGIE